MSRLTNMTERKRIEDVSYDLVFNHAETHDLGYSFNCDENGNVNVALLTPTALANLDDCRTGRNNHVCAGVRRYVNRYTVPATGKCVCGRTVELDDPLDNVCECGRCYNMSGQPVVPSWECDEQGNPYEFN